MELTLPLLGDVMTEGTLAKWLQADGAEVNQGEPLYELETDKVTLTVDAPASGTLQRVISEGETVPVGTVVGRLASAVISRSSARPVPQGGASVAPGEVAVAALSTERAAERVQVRATPAARAAARRLGVDLSRIANGRRLREADVLAAQSGSRLSGRRKAIAERMRASLANSAQLTVSMEVDVTDALRLRNQLKQLLSEEARPSINDVVIRATVLALREHPALNATLHDGHVEIQPEVHMGLAVDADEGLIVPVVPDAHTLDLMGLAQRTRALSRRARSNTLGVDDVQGGTFTVTSLGPLGVDFFTPIINPPQVAILGIGRVFAKLTLTDGRVEERQCMYLNLSFDHQVIDGAPAARFLQSVKTFLELPAGLLMSTNR